MTPNAWGNPILIISRADAILWPMIEMIFISFIFIKQNKSKMLDEKCIPVIILNFMAVYKSGGLRRASSPKALFDVYKCALGMSNNRP